jgi:hypothetical protein
MIGFINTFVYNLSYSQSIIALSLIYPLQKSLGHAIRFLATDLSQELSFQITIKSSCHFLINRLGLQTLQNSTQFSNPNSLILDNSLFHFIFFRLDTPRELFWLQTEVSVTVGFSLYSLGSDHSTENTVPVLLDACITRCIATVAARTTENTALVFLGACLLRELPRNWSMRHNFLTASSSLPRNSNPTNVFFLSHITYNVFRFCSKFAIMVKHELFPLADAWYYDPKLSHRHYTRTMTSCSDDQKCQCGIKSPAI